jgi:tetratricopeptide (TPR) repeat protein
VSLKELSNSYTILGILNKNKGYYQISVSNYLKALEFSQLLGDWKRASVYLNNIGVILFLNGQSNEAIDYYYKSVKLEKQAKNREQLSIRYYNLGESYQSLNDFDSANFYFETSLAIEKEIKNELGIKYALYGLSNLYLSVKNYEVSGTYIDSVNYLNFEVDDIELECKILLNKVELEIIAKSYQSAFRNCLAVKELSMKHEYVELHIFSLEKLSRIYALTNNHEKELDILKKINSIQKERYQEQINIKVGELQKLYEQEQQEQEIELLKNIEKINALEINHSKKIKNYFFFTIIIVIIIFIFNIINLNRMRKKQ